MGNNKIIIISGGVFVLFLIVIIFFNFLSKLKPSSPVENTSITPSVSVPFTGRRFIPPQNSVSVSEQTLLFNKQALIAKLPLQEDSYRIEYDATHDQFNFFVSNNSTLDAAIQDFNNYLKENKLDINGQNIHINLIANKNDSSNTIATGTSVQDQSIPKSTTQSEIDNIIEVFQKQKQVIQHTTTISPTIRVERQTSPPSNSSPGSQSLINNILTIFDAKKSQTLHLPQVSPTVSQIKVPVSSESIATQNKFTQLFAQLFTQIKPPEPTPTLIPIKINPTQPADNIPISSQLFTDYGLPPPISSGQYGYQNQLNRIRTNETIRWNVENLLRGEKIAKEKGINVKPYITTGWMWFDVIGPAGYPDVYGVNCNDDDALSNISIKCSTLGSGDFQIAGYQAGDRAGDYVSLFTRLYQTDQLESIMNAVIDNSFHASRSKWNYVNNNQGILRYLVNNKVPTNISIGDIASNKTQLLDDRKQLFTLILGKDPTMAIALNSFAVSDGGLIQCLKTKSLCYGYINAEAKQRFSNIIAALILFDRGSLP